MWDILVGVLLIYTALVAPIRIAFEDETPVGWLAVDLVIDSLFLGDIVLTFLTGYRDKKVEGGVVLDCRQVCVKYWKGWFVIDAFATFPFQMIEYVFAGESNNYNQFLRLLRLPRIYRLIRLFKCVRLMNMPSLKKLCKYLRINDGEWQSDSGVKRLLFVTALALFFSHLVTCLWLLFAKLYNYSSDTWIVRKGVEDRSAMFQYLMGFYWTAQTITTVGFGDIPAVTELELGLALIWMILGVAFYSYVIGNFSSMIASIDQQNR